MDAGTLTTMFSSAKTTGTDEWATPQDVFEALDAEFKFVLDAAAQPINAKVGTYFTAKDDALKQDWLNEVASSCGSPIPDAPAVWLNPPYSLQDKFLAKVVEEVAKGLTVVCLLPSRTGTRRWHKYIWDKEKHQPRPGVEVRFLSGRLKFGGSTNSAPFDSVVVVFRPPHGYFEIPSPCTGSLVHPEYSLCPACDSGRR